MWGGGGHPLPAMQCWAASTNHLPAVSEGGWARIWGQPRRVLGQTQWERISERGKQLCLVLQESSYSRASAVLFLFATPFLCDLCFLVIKDCLLFIPHSAFHPLSFLHFPSVFVFFFSLWMEWEIFVKHLHSLLSSSLHHVPWASVLLAGKSRRNVWGWTDSLWFALRQIQLFLVL